MLLLLLLLCVAGAQQCVYTQNHWRGLNETLWPVRGATLCGTPWPQLMRLEVAQLEDPGQAVWLDCFHHCCAAAQNLARLSGNNDARRLVTALVDLMERACSDVSAWSAAWRDEPHFLALLEQVRALNRGGGGWPACADEFSPPPFSFAARPDLFLVRLPSNETVAAGAAYFAAALGHALTIETTLLVFIALSVLLSLAVIVMWCMLVRKHRVKYDLTRPREQYRTESLQHDAFGIAREYDEEDSIELDSVGKLEHF